MGGGALESKLHRMHRKGCKMPTRHEYFCKDFFRRKDNGSEVSHTHTCTLALKIARGFFIKGFCLTRCLTFESLLTVVYMYLRLCTTRDALITILWMASSKKKSSFLPRNQHNLTQSFQSTLLFSSNPSYIIIESIPKLRL